MEIEAPARRSPWYLRFIFGRNPVWTVVRILFVTFIALVLFKYVLVPIRVTGQSMYPTYKHGQIKFVNKLAYNRRDPQRGDVVAVRFAGDDILLLKRIIALPGETVSVYNGEVYVNKKKLEEPYAHGRIPAGYGSMDPEKLGPDEYIILGDNRKISEGYVKYRRDIIGKVL